MVATRQATADFLVEQAAAAGAVSARKMFGEYALYVDGRLVALICDDQLYVKPTDAGRAFAGALPQALPQALPYAGATPQLMIDQDRIEDAEWLAELLRVTARSLPLPKPKGPKPKVSKKPKVSRSRSSSKTPKAIEGSKK